MASTQELKILINAKDDASAVLKGLSDQLGDVFAQMTAIGAVAFGALAAGIYSVVKESMGAEAAQARLTHIIQTSTGASQEQVMALMSQARAMEQIGVVSASNVTSLHAQLATFDMQAENIAALTPAILDYVVAEKGATVGTEDLKAMTNGLAQALNGNYQSLTKTGFVLSEETKAIIENGTETEKVNEIVKVLNSTYEGFNAMARQTAEGGLAVLNNEINNVKQAIGEALMPTVKEMTAQLIPVLQSIGQWIEQNPVLVKEIVSLAAQVTGLTAVLGTVGLTLIWLSANPFVIVAAGLVSLGVAIYTIITRWEEFKEGVVIIWGQVVDVVRAKAQQVLEIIMPWITFIGTVMQNGWDAIVKTVTDIWNGIGVFISGAMELVRGIIEEGINAVAAVWNSVWNGMVNAVATAYASIMKWVNGIIGGVQSAIAQIVSLSTMGVGGLSLSSPNNTLLNLVSGKNTRAAGGPVSAGTSYLVGERGPEIFTPSTFGAITPNHALGGGITVNITGNEFIGEEGVANRIASTIMSQLRQNIRV